MNTTTKPQTQTEEFAGGSRPRAGKAVEHMTLDELHAEGKRLQGEMMTLAERTQRVYDLMYHQARRNPNFSSPAYISLANGGKRLASMVHAGLKRAGSFDRVLANVKKDLEEQTQAMNEKQARKDAKAVREGRQPDPLFDLFGPDVVTKGPLETEGLGDPDDLNDVFGEEV